MKTIITIAIGLIMSLVACKKSTTTSPEPTQPIVETPIKYDSLYRDITFNLLGDSAEILVNGVAVLKMSDLKPELTTLGIPYYRQDTFINYIGTKQFYKGDLVTINIKGLSQIGNDVYAYSIYYCYYNPMFIYNQNNQNYFPNGVILPYTTNSSTFIVE